MRCDIPLRPDFVVGLLVYCSSTKVVNSRLYRATMMSRFQYVRYQSAAALFFGRYTITEGGPRVDKGARWVWRSVTVLTSAP